MPHGGNVVERGATFTPGSCKETEKGEPIGVEAGDDQSRQQRRRSRDRDDGNSGVYRRPHEPRAGVGNQRRPGVGHDSERVTALESPHERRRRFRLVVFVVRGARRRDGVAIEQVARVSGILGEDELHRL